MMDLPNDFAITDIAFHSIYTDPEYEKSRVALRYFASFNKKLTVTMKRHFPIDYEIIIEDLKKTPKFQDTPIMTYKTSTTPLIIVNQKYIVKPNYIYELLYRLFEYEDKTHLVIYKRMAIAEYAKYFQENKQFEYVYMDFVIQNDRLSIPQRVVFELDVKNVPKTCQNFIELIKGTHTTPDGKKLHYKDTLIHKVWSNGFIQGGDVEHQNGKGGYSIYGKYFEDENYLLKHDKPGILGMAGNGSKHTNSSQFYVTLIPLPKYDNKFVVFGRVVDGFRVLKMINKLIGIGTKPKFEIRVTDCGMYHYNLRKVEVKKPKGKVGPLYGGFKKK